MNWRNPISQVEELRHGLIVVIAARWVLLLSAWVLTLWEPEEPSAWQLRLAIVLLMSYSVANFFLTVQWVKGAAILPQLVYATSFADLTLITTLIVALSSYSSNLYVFYFPAILALAVTFPRTLTGLFTAGVIAAYALISVDKAGPAIDTQEAQTIVVRAILLAAVAFCGALYQQVESDRREGKGRMFQVFTLGVPEPPTSVYESTDESAPVAALSRH
jgi:hypothetical protein